MLCENNLAVFPYLVSGKFYLINKWIDYNGNTK